MHFVKRSLCILLAVACLFCVSFSAGAYTTDDVVNAALEMIFTHEGNYTSVVANDNGALSIGKVGWHGYRALQLLKSIVNADKEQGRELLGEELYNEVLTASDSKWNTRTLSASEKNAVSKLLATEESKKAQDALAFSDIKSYIVHGQSLGIQDGKALVFFADIENQMGSLGSERVGKAAIALAGSADKVTVDNMYKAAMADKTASSSPTRRKSAYDYCKSLTFGADGVETEFFVGEYKVTASSLRVRSGPGTSYDTVTSSIPNGTKVKVAEVSGDWGKIVYKGKTGWINLLYAEYITVTPAVTPDVNGNGMVDAGDARLALRAASNMETLSTNAKKAADADSDGRITAADARIILRIASKLQ